MKLSEKYAVKIAIASLDEAGHPKDIFTNYESFEPLSDKIDYIFVYRIIDRKTRNVPSWCEHNWFGNLQDAVEYYNSKIK